MTEFVFPAPPTPGLPVKGGGVFPVRRVYCIGRNYAAHAVEMGHDPDREAPFFFQKNPDNLSPTEMFAYPPESNDVHHEAEIAVFLKSGGAGISMNDALDHVFGYALALDMTRRDLQAEAKKAGRPWEIGKAFEGSAPVGPIHPVADCGHLCQGAITLHCNGTLRQTGDLNQMIWKVPEMIAYLSRFFTLAAGDVILSGTPAGVGPVVAGDELKVTAEGLGSMTVRVI